MTSHSGAAGLRIALIVGALLVAAYAAYASDGMYQQLDTGRSRLSSALTQIKASSSPDVAAVQADLKAAEQAFGDAQARAHNDPALHLLGAAPVSGPQVDAAARLGAIGSDLSRAGEGAADVAAKLAALKQQVAAAPISAEQLSRLLQEAQATTTSYQGSIDQIGAELKAAHAERAQVSTTGLLPPLRHAYEDIDRALDEADTAFLRYQDVRRLLADWLGLPLPG